MLALPGIRLNILSEEAIKISRDFSRFFSVRILLVERALLARSVFLTRPISAQGGIRQRGDHSRPKDQTDQTDRTDQETSPEACPIQRDK